MLEPLQIAITQDYWGISSQSVRSGGSTTNKYQN
nr:MAG TPA: hypothetical protein [Crassvirales sp.]